MNSVRRNLDGVNINDGVGLGERLRKLITQGLEKDTSDQVSNIIYLQNYRDNNNNNKS